MPAGRLSSTGFSISPSHSLKLRERDEPDSSNSPALRLMFPFFGSLSPFLIRYAGTERPPSLSKTSRAIECEAGIPSTVAAVLVMTISSWSMIICRPAASYAVILKVFSPGFVSPYVSDCPICKWEPT